eukprot:GILJ01003451.1.p1 GENE.GILJ01003451.1~~GILJ01003451.1.p1  ORF type:complete len:235 (-),score=34.97 GILJ01003451.1:94-756(-)
MGKHSGVEEAGHDYVVQKGVRPNDILRRLRDETASLGSIQRMQVSEDEGQFFTFLMETIGAKKTIEVGVFTGYSTLCTALGLPADGKVVALDISDEWTRVGSKYWREAGVHDKIDLRLGPAVESMDQMIANGESGTYDFVFIDADKTNYPNYYERAIQLLRVGGVVAVDNVLWGGKVWDETINDEDTVAIRNVTNTIANDQRVTPVMLSLSDGVMLARKR